MKRFLFILISLFLFLYGFSQDLLRYVDGENTLVQSDWRLKQPKVSGSGYDYFSMANDGTPLQPAIGNDSYRGTHCLVYEVNSSSVKERIEHKFANIDDADATLFETEHYYGFALKMDASKFDDLSSSLIFWQAWQGTPYNPPVCLKFMTQKNTAGEYRVKLAIRNDDTGPINGTEADAGSFYLSKGVWHTFQIYLLPDYNSANGQITVWIDGTQRMSYKGKIGYTPDPPTNDSDTDFKYNGVVCKWGIYQPDANTGHRLFFDEIKYGNTFNSVLPSDNVSEVPQAVQPKYQMINKTLLFEESIDKITLMNTNGQILLQAHHINSLDLSTFKQGVYILKINTVFSKIIL